MRAFSLVLLRLSKSWTIPDSRVAWVPLGTRLQCCENARAHLDWAAVKGSVAVEASAFA